MTSTQPRKQRKKLYEAALHQRHRLVSATLAEELRRQFKRRSMPLRKGDQVMVMRGKFNKLRGAVTRVNLKKMKVYVEGAKIKKVGGTEVQTPLQPSSLMITKLVLDDKKRQKALQRTAEAEADRKQVK